MKSKAWSDIFTMAINISKTTKDDVFMEYTAHTDTIYIYVDKGGWKKRKWKECRMAYFKTEEKDGPSRAIEFIMDSLYGATGE